MSGRVSKLQVFKYLGPALKALRLSRGLSLAQLADASAIAAVQIAGYEKRRMVPNVRTLDRLLTILEVTPLELAVALSLAQIAYRKWSRKAGQVLDSRVRLLSVTGRKPVYPRVTMMVESYRPMSEEGREFLRRAGPLLEGVLRLTERKGGLDPEVFVVEKPAKKDDKSQQDKALPEEPEPEKGEDDA